MRWRGLDEAAPGQYTTLAAALDERRELMQRYVPAETLALHRRVVDQLRDSGLPASALSAGSEAPMFELPDHDGRQVTLASLLASGPAVLLFFRGRWCPFCVAQLEAWNQLLPSISRAGIAVAAISPQTEHQVSLMHDQHHLHFPLLSDSGNRVARRFGLVYSVPEEQRLVYRRTFVNLPFVNGDESWALPIPATFAVGRGGAILFSSVDADYTRRPEPLDVLAAAEAAARG
jgi:peroxiredoxin